MRRKLANDMLKEKKLIWSRDTNWYGRRLRSQSVSCVYVQGEIPVVVMIRQKC